MAWQKKYNYGVNIPQCRHKGKETEKPLCVTDYNHKMEGVDLKDQLWHMYTVERKKMTKWYLKLFKWLLNSTVLNSFAVYQQVMGRNIQQLLYRIQLVEGLCTKYARAAETQSVPGRQASDNTVPRLTERHFLRKVAGRTENQNFRGGVLCAQNTEKRKFQCTAAKYVMWVFAWKIALNCITRSSITEVMTIILLHLYSFKISLLKF